MARSNRVCKQNHLTPSGDNRSRDDPSDRVAKRTHSLGTGHPFSWHTSELPPVTCVRPSRIPQRRVKCNLRNLRSSTRPRTFEPDQCPDSRNASPGNSVKGVEHRCIGHCLGPHRSPETRGYRKRGAVAMHQEEERNAPCRDPLIPAPVPDSPGVNGAGPGGAERLAPIVLHLPPHSAPAGHS